VVCGILTSIAPGNGMFYFNWANQFTIVEKRSEHLETGAVSFEEVEETFQSRNLLALPDPLFFFRLDVASHKS
jgi:hypothetical protein